MKKFLRRLVIRVSTAIDRILLWIGYSIGCWRNVSQQLEVLESRSDKDDVMIEVEILDDICTRTCMDREYIKKAVQVRLSAAIIRYLELSGYEREKRIISSSPEILKSQIEDWGKVTIEKFENDRGYKYNGKSGNYWNMVDFSPDIMKLFQLFFILQYIDRVESRHCY